MVRLEFSIAGNASTCETHDRATIQHVLADLTRVTADRVDVHCGAAVSDSVPISAIVPMANYTIAVQVRGELYADLNTRQQASARLGVQVVELVNIRVISTYSPPPPFPPLSSSPPVSSAVPSSGGSAVTVVLSILGVLLLAGALWFGARHASARWHRPPPEAILTKLTVQSGATSRGSLPGATSQCSLGWGSLSNEVREAMGGQRMLIAQSGLELTASTEKSGPTLETITSASDGYYSAATHLDESGGRDEAPPASPGRPSRIPASPGRSSRLEAPPASPGRSEFLRASKKKVLGRGNFGVVYLMQLENVTALGLELHRTTRTGVLTPWRTR